MKTWNEFAKDNAQLMQQLADNQVPLSQINHIWLQAKCRCEYCCIDLLESAAVFRGAESDHILPQKGYPNLTEKLSNYAMACASCHKLKSSYCFDPGEGDPQLEKLVDLSDDLRLMLINKVIDRLDEHKRKQAETLKQIKRIIAADGLR